MAPTILLWDIDGTLISTAGVGRQAIVQTVLRRYGRADVLDFPFDGMTDPLIVRQALAGLGIASERLDDEAAGTLGDYLELLGRLCAAGAGFRVHAGVEAALVQCGGRPDVAVGLGTGNVETGARLKLGPVRLNPHFAFGGFGCDHADRARLLEVGARRGAARLAVDRGACRVVVIGDTPRDIAAARAIGADCIAVATGSFSVESLRAHQPDLAVPTMADPEARRALLA